VPERVPLLCIASGTDLFKAGVTDAFVTSVVVKGSRRRWSTHPDRPPRGAAGNAAGPMIVPIELPCVDGLNKVSAEVEALLGQHSRKPT
jgi:hypothetical protein